MGEPRSTFNANEGRPVLGHVNLMVDTFIANAHVDDLRSIARNLLATNPPSFSVAFTEAARSRLRQTSGRFVVNASALFVHESGGNAAPSDKLKDVLFRVRALYGAGMGFDSLRMLAMIVHASIGLRWEDDSNMSNTLAFIDADIGQAIQSSKEEIEAGRMNDRERALEIFRDLQTAVKDSMKDVQTWGGEFPYERAKSSLDHWKMFSQ